MPKEAKSENRAKTEKSKRGQEMLHTSPGKSAAAAARALDKKAGCILRVMKRLLYLQNRILSAVAKHAAALNMRVASVTLGGAHIERTPGSLIPGLPRCHYTALACLNIVLSFSIEKHAHSDRSNCRRSEGDRRR